MKRTLYLLRHSYAEPMGDLPDFERSLTMEGLSAVRTLGRKLLSDNVNLQQIICSSAVRAYDTAMNLAEELEISEQTIQSEDKLYEASVRELLEVTNGLEFTSENSLIVGHNPSISYFAELLTSSGIGNMEPCGLVTITFDAAGWEEIAQGVGKLLSYYHPNHDV